VLIAPSETVATRIECLRRAIEREHGVRCARWNRDRLARPNPDHRAVDLEHQLAFDHGGDLFTLVLVSLQSCARIDLEISHLDLLQPDSPHASARYVGPERQQRSRNEVCASSGDPLGHEAFCPSSSWHAGARRRADQRRDLVGAIAGQHVIAAVDARRATANA